MKKLSDYKNYDDWVVAILKSDKKRADNFLKLALEEFNKDGDVATLLVALRHVAQAKGGVSQLSNKTKITRESLYTILSKKGNPTITTFQSIVGALGYTISLKRASN